MAPYASHAKLGTYADGESFIAEFERIIRPWRERIEVHAGDLRKETWNGQPIEVLLVDAMKSWELTDHILRKFYGDLIEGDGYVIHQDFSNCFTPWIHLISYRLRGRLSPAIDVRRSETMVFRVVSSPGCSGDALGASREAFDEAEIERSFAYSLSITRAEKHSGIHGARAMLYFFDGDVERAGAYVDRVEAAGLLNGFHAEAVRLAMKPAGSVA